jgi:hypothetical protein
MCLINRFKHASITRKRETEPKTQIPLMGMEKLGTKGPLLLHYYNREPMFCLRFQLFRKKMILITGSFKEIQERGRRKENFV